MQFVAKQAYYERIEQNTRLHKHYTTKVVSIIQSQKANLVLRFVKLQTGHFTLTIKNNGLSGRMASEQVLSYRVILLMHKA